MKSEDEEWTVTKLRVLLGRHISAMEMAGSEEVTVTYSHQHLKSTAGGLLAGNSHKNPGNSQKRSQYRQPRCIYCGESHWSDECSKYN